MIDGVVVRELKLIPDKRGWLTELLRSDWELFERFGHVYLTTVYPDVVKAWHYPQEANRQHDLHQRNAEARPPRLAKGFPDVQAA